MDTSKAIGIIIANPEFEDVRSLEGVAPVSDTHLDVYKRQGTNCSNVKRFIVRPPCQWNLYAAFLIAVYNHITFANKIKAIGDERMFKNSCK